MRRPSFQFYPADWRSNAKLRRCSQAERRIWIELLCLLHDSEEYGVLRWPLRDLATAIGCRVQELRALQVKGVLKGADPGERSEPFVFIPRHAGRDGEPVMLIVGQAGPIWYSSRMVRDEYVRTKRGAGTRFGEEPMATPKAAPKPPIGYGPSSSPSSSPSEKLLNPLSGGDTPDGMQPGKEKAGKADKRAARAAAGRAIEYLNAKAGTRYPPVEANLKLPAARMLYDGASEADLMAVVDLKVAEAAREEFPRKFLRPATLWNGEKFAQYVGQVNAQAPVSRPPAPPQARVQLLDADGCVKRDLGDVPAGPVLEVAKRTARNFSIMIKNLDAKYVAVLLGADRSQFSVEELRA